ncbi:hypothetical protein AAGS40_30390 (plasmid) [Paraburkholderia sp. PREW-6R]|uniref:hypothetical protein n=1 Tax=Paraburkholderia sp. PREW-6R TaxID=3141544 RepID=UPI0031F52AE3
MKIRLSLYSQVKLVVYAALLLLAGLTRSGFAAEDSPADRIVQVRGQDAVAEELVMGPKQTEFWFKLRSLIDHPEWINDFSRIVKLFDLTITDPVDVISADTPGFKARFDAKDEHFFAMSSTQYGIGPDIKGDGRVLSFEIDIHTEEICITDREVRRIYGRGVVGVASHWGVPPALAQDPTGVLYSVGYRSEGLISRAPISMSYAPSGCVENITFRQSVSN